MPFPTSGGRAAAPQSPLHTDRFFLDKFTVRRSINYSGMPTSIVSIFPRIARLRHVRNTTQAPAMNKHLTQLQCSLRDTERYTIFYTWLKMNWKLKITATVGSFVDKSSSMPNARILQTTVNRQMMLRSGNDFCNCTRLIFIFVVARASNAISFFQRQWWPLKLTMVSDDTQSWLVSLNFQCCAFTMTA